MIKNYKIVKDVKEALTYKKQNPQAAFYAGGTEINRLNSSVKIEDAISLEGLGLNKIEEVKDGIKIGSCVTFQQLVESDLIPAYLKEAAMYCASRVVRDMATIGGNLALGADDSYLMPTLLAAKARLLTNGLTDKEVFTEDNLPIREYHMYHKEFSNTLLVAIVLPREERIVLSKRFANTAHSESCVTAAFGAKVEAGLLSEVRIFAAIKGSGIQRFKDAENSIETDSFASREDVEFAITNATQAVDDYTASAKYKSYITGVAIGDMYAVASEAAKGGK
ncbi:MAG: FAD binding domain-containing protein [Sphaerochaeta sp.]